MPLRTGDCPRSGRRPLNTSGPLPGLRGKRAGPQGGTSAEFARRQIGLLRVPGGPLQRMHRTDDTARTATVERVADPAGLDLEAVWDEEWEKNLAVAAIERVKQQVKAKQFQMFELYVLQQWPVRDVARMRRVSTAQIDLRQAPHLPVDQKAS